MLFSATLSQRVLELAYEHMNNPELMRIEPDKITVDKVRQLIYFPAMEEKIPLLIGLLRLAEAARTMVFVNTRRMAERLEEVLRANGINAQALSGDVPQNKRLRFLQEFHSGELAVLIATDVASRGLHIPDVSHVFNYDLPQDSADYVHRIGRTARAGAEGDAISFGCEDYAICAAGHRELHRPQDSGRPVRPGEPAEARARSVRAARPRCAATSAPQRRRWRWRRRRRTRAPRRPTARRPAAPALATRSRRLLSAELAVERGGRVDLRQRLADDRRMHRDRAVLHRVEPVGAGDRVDVAVEHQARRSRPSR